MAPCCTSHIITAFIRHCDCFLNYYLRMNTWKNCPAGCVFGLIGDYLEVAFKLRGVLDDPSIFYSYKSGKNKNSFQFQLRKEIISSECIRRCFFQKWWRCCLFCIILPPEDINYVMDDYFTNRCRSTRNCLIYKRCICHRGSSEWHPWERCTKAIPL